MVGRWECNDNYSVWTFHISEGCKWSNGDWSLPKTSLFLQADIDPCIRVPIPSTASS
jgi:ABC-type oligopeptide transport system substrate-binding subunit